MPFKSKAQRGYMWVHHPTIARRWAHETGNKRRLPKRVGRRRGGGGRRR